MSGLKPYICLARGARSMLTANLWVQKGLVNGATGTLRHFIFELGVAPPLLPIALVVEMDQGYRGPYLPGKERLVCDNCLFAF
jgi:ATP-dependent DNA helicase PIF1